MDAADRRRSALAGERDLPSDTSDGHHVTLLCNVATAAETAMGLEAGAEGAEFLIVGAPNTGPGDAEMVQDWWGD